MTNRTGETYTGNQVKSIFICEDDGTPFAIVKETILDNLRNYKILTPADKEFKALTRAMGFDIDLVSY